MDKAEKTKEYIIEKAAPIFNRKGYSGTSLSDILEATGLTKGSVYGNFENKDEVAIAVYKHSIAGLQNRFAAAMSSKKTATDKLIAITNYYRTEWKQIFERGGCPIQNASIEADDHISFLRKHVQQSIKSWVGTISTIIEEGQKKSEFTAKINAQEYAYTIITILEGGIMLSKIMNNPQLLFAALDRIELLIKKEMKK